MFMQTNSTNQNLDGLFETGESTSFRAKPQNITNATISLKLYYMLTTIFSKSASIKLMRLIKLNPRTSERLRKRFPLTRGRGKKVGWKLYWISENSFVELFPIEKLLADSLFFVPDKQSTADGCINCRCTSTKVRYIVRQWWKWIFEKLVPCSIYKFHWNGTLRNCI